jgi:hypothetical protein
MAHSLDARATPVSNGHHRACSGARRTQCQVRRGDDAVGLASVWLSGGLARWRHWAGRRSRSMRAEGGRWPWSLAYRT